MATWRFWRLVILAALLAGFGWTLLNRKPIGGAKPATIGTSYKTERDWAIHESATDIERMAAFASKRDPRPVTTQLPELPWDLDGFRVLAAAAFGTDRSSDAGLQTDFYPSLTALDVAALVDSSNQVSSALAKDMRDPRAHESAALVIGAFALRDAADQFTDVRWALNRMTAHLAVASMLRQGEGGSPDGAIAQVIFSTLTNQQTRAVSQLAALGTGAPPEPMNAWVRALRMRVTQDWRVLPDPSHATRLEKLEYFRSRRATVRRRRAAEDLEATGEALAADFARLAQDGIVGVEDGGVFIEPALELELTEARDAYQRVHGSAMPASLPESLNHRASYLVNSTPAVLPWGAWAEFFQRHLAMNVGMIDSYYRYSLGDAGRADEAKAQLNNRLGKLQSFPLGTYRRTKGRNATEADLAELPRVVELAETAPELITERAWVFFERGSHYESIRTAMPLTASWFAPPTPDVPFEAGVRYPTLPPDDAVVNDVIGVAPADTWLLIGAADRDAATPTVTRARELLRSRDQFDLRAIDALLKREKDEAVHEVLQRKACDLSSRDCIALAATLAERTNEADAARMYERAFADRMIDSLAVAADAEWLVDYYRRHFRLDDAIALADRAASTGSVAGLATRGHLRERLADLNGAEEDLGRIALSYDSREYLLGFYYRRVEVAHDEAYRHKWTKWLTETFPNGLQPEPVTIQGTPKTGVFVSRDSERSRKAGIRTGDIIVGLEGWRVDSLRQYRAINEFFDQPRVKLTVWRGALIKIEGDAPTRLFGMQIETHPLKGWIE
jgi:hypothetical protein